MSKLCFGALAMIALSGCAATPDVEYRYFPARATTLVTVTQTVDCNQSKTQYNFIHTPTVVTTYSSDRSKHFVLRTRDLQSTFADADVKFDWYDDGRLRSVNQSSTGQGESIVKAALTFLAPIVGGAAPDTGDCDKLTALGGGKPLTIVYERTVEYPKRPESKSDMQTDQVHELQANSNSKAAYNSVKALLRTNLPSLDFRVMPWIEPMPLVEPAEESWGTIPLWLNKTVQAPVEVRVSKVVVWNGKVVVPTADTYQLPIPKPKLFGKQAFALTLNEAGGITTMGYTSLSGTAGAFNALSQLSATVSPSDSAKVNAMKAEADLIAQTQRLANCQATPADCK